MKAIRVNADYESELFHGRPGSSIINHSLEFLALYLSDRPLYTQKIYTDEYLNYVGEIKGEKPSLVRAGKFDNWWGPLNDLEHERWMNSKLTSMELDISQGWSQDSFILIGSEELKGIQIKREMLLKDAFGMSGMGLKRIRNSGELSQIKNFPSILGPLLNRKYDFSHYVFPDGRMIAYENLVDDRFQYRGTLFRNIFKPTVDELKFYGIVGWNEFSDALMKIKANYSQRALQTGFSVDSFIYEENDEHKIHFLCEVNYRRTMGLTAYELALRYSKALPWNLYLLAKADKPDFKKLLERLQPLSNVILLSPPDVRYQMFLISAENDVEGRSAYEQLKKLLPECQFAVNIED